MTKTRISLIATIVTLFLLSANAQAPFKKELNIGGSFGLGFSSISFEPKIQQNQLSVASLGITGRWITENHLGLIAEINYSQQGWDEKFEDSQYKYTRRMNVVELPILTHIYFGGKKVRCFVNLGPKVGYIIGENITTNFSEGIGTKNEVELRDKAIQNNFTWGLCGGPGVELRTAIGYFLLEGRYYYALGDIFHNKRDDTFKKSSSQILSAKLTYFLPLKK